MVVPGINFLRLPVVEGELSRINERLFNFLWLSFK